MTGIELITQERKRQLIELGRSIALDIELNTVGQIGFAIVSLCSEYDGSGKKPGNDEARLKHFERWCPLGWDKILWMKMISKPYKERLIIAGALAAAEIDRLQNIEL